MLVTRTEQYFYQPTPEDLTNFEAIWAVLWHPRFKNLPKDQYALICSFAFEAFIVGINQKRLDIALDLEKTLNQS